MTYNPYEHTVADSGSLLRLDAKVAVVTGASSRIGREIARVFAAHGAHVVVADILDEQGKAVVEEISRHTAASYVHADVSRSADIQGMIDHAVARFGRLDILVNNAHWEKHGTVVELEEADWDRSMDVLIKALYLGCKYAIPHMRAAGGGVIVNLASVHAFNVGDAYVTYETAKASIINFTRQVAWDFGPEGIRVNTICPGAIPTAEHVAPRLDDQAWLDEYLLTNPTKRPGHPRDIAFAALFLVSDLATWVNGASLTVDGGEFNGFVTTSGQRLKAYLREHPERIDALLR
jgi:NAD(P)-dependent dehydrogenase (short-subunit alcohol dehydrogenase family)